MMEGRDEMPAVSELLERSARRIEMGERMTVAEVEALQREVQAEKEARQQLAVKLQQVEQQNQVLHDHLAATSGRAREEARVAQQRIDELRQQLQNVKKAQKAAIQRGVNYNLAQRQEELNQLERAIQHAEANLKDFRQRLKERTGDEHENHRLNIDADKALRELLVLGTTLNMYESEVIYPVNWELLDRIAQCASAMTALIAEFKEHHRQAEKPVAAV